MLKLGCVNGGRFSDHHKALASGLAPRPALEVRDGDLLVSRANTRELVGSCAVVRGARPQLMLSDLLYRLHVDSHRWNTEYLSAALNAPSVRDQIRPVAAGSAGSMPKIDHELIKNLTVPHLDPGEQLEVVDWLKAHSRGPQSLLSELVRLEVVLIEYRAALIAEAVTGQLDVTKLSEQQLDESARAAVEGGRPEVLPA